MTSVLWCQTDVGLVRDELVYMQSGSRYADWWIDLASFKQGTTSRETITKTFGGPRATDNNREHPPLMKTLFGLSHRILHRSLGLTSEITAYRAPTAVMFGILAMLVFCFAVAVWGEAAAIVAAILVVLSPRLFFHAGLATFDAPVVTTWFGCLYAYYRALSSRRWTIVLGLAVGVALATKHNAIMLPAVFLCHYGWLAWRRRQVADGIGRNLRAWSAAALSIRPLFLPALFILGPLVAIVLWPWLWFDTWSHVGDWLAFHLKHVHYNFEYLGRNWNAPPYPWHVAIVTTLLTVPTVTIVAFVIGLVAVVRTGEDEKQMSPAVLLFLSAGVAIGPFLLTTTPIFGAEKHWAPIMPTVAIYAGIGVTAAVGLFLRIPAVARTALGRVKQPVVLALVSSMCIGAAAVETATAQPFGLSHYTALAGGPSGGADLGMNRQFWGSSARGVLPFLNQHAPAQGQPAVPVYSHDASPAWGFYHRMGLLASGLPDAGREQAGVDKSQLAIVIHERHFRRHDFMIWASYGTVQPVFVLSYRGVPLVSVYRRPSPTSKTRRR